MKVKISAVVAAIAAATLLPAAARAGVITLHPVMPTVVTPQVSNPAPSSSPAPAPAPITQPTPTSDSNPPPATSPSSSGGFTLNTDGHGSAGDYNSPVNDTSVDNSAAARAFADATFQRVADDNLRIAWDLAGTTIAIRMTLIAAGFSNPAPAPAATPIPNATPSDPGGVAAIIDSVFGTGAAKKKDGSEQQQQ